MACSTVSDSGLVFGPGSPGLSAEVPSSSAMASRLVPPIVPLRKRLVACDSVSSAALAEKAAAEVMSRVLNPRARVFLPSLFIVE